MASRTGVDDGGQQVQLILVAPKYLMPENVILTTKTEQTWLELLNGDELKLGVEEGDGTFLHSSGYTPTNPMPGQGWRAEVTDKISSFISKFKKCKEGRYRVVICKGLMTPGWRSGTTKEAPPPPPPKPEPAIRGRSPTPPIQSSVGPLKRSTNTVAAPRWRTRKARTFHCRTPRTLVVPHPCPPRRSLRRMALSKRRPRFSVPIRKTSSSPSPEPRTPGRWEQILDTSGIRDRASSESPPPPPTPTFQIPRPASSTTGIVSSSEGVGTLGWVTGTGNYMRVNPTGAQRQEDAEENNSPMRLRIGSVRTLAAVDPPPVEPLSAPGSPSGGDGSGQRHLEEEAGAGGLVDNFTRSEGDDEEEIEGIGAAGLDEEEVEGMEVVVDEDANSFAVRQMITDNEFMLKVRREIRAVKNGGFWIQVVKQCPSACYLLEELTK